MFVFTENNVSLYHNGNSVFIPVYTELICPLVVARGCCNTFRQLQVISNTITSSHILSMCSRRVGDVFEGGAGGGEKACTLRKELGDLEKVERSLDELIHSSTAQLKQLTEHEDNQRYPLHAAVFVSTCRCTCLWVSSRPVCTCKKIHFISALTLDPTPYAGLCDVSGHPLHRQPQRPDSHRCQGPC